MGNVLDLTNGKNSLWAGQNNEQYYGDDLANQSKPFYGYNHHGIINNQTISSARLEQLLAQLALNQQQPQTQSAVLPVSDLSTFVSENKWLLLGGAAILAYMFLGAGGGGLAESTVVKRYAVKK